MHKPVAEAALLESLARAVAPQAQGSPPPASHWEQPGVPPMDVLVVEDNEMSRVVIARFLEKGGHRVTLAESAAQALAAMERRRFDLALVDLLLPEMDGFEAVAAVRRREQGTGAHLPIIAVTAHATPGVRERAMEAGGDAFLVKPIKPRELYDAVRTITPQREPLAAGKGAAR